MPGGSPDPRAGSRTGIFSLGLAAVAALLVLAACAPAAQETAAFDPWFPAENEVLGKGTAAPSGGEMIVYWVVWRGGEVVIVKSSSTEGNDCYEAATIREQLPDFCPEPEDLTPVGATEGVLTSPPT
ncbi:MAG: hypothetical protein QF664_12575 [Dehalococcoidia bacterium]|nr:hypothetical protein [Dehalococcoidia bacterium]